MRSSWKIGSVAGIGIYLHVTFLILLAWVGVSGFLPRHSWQDAVKGVGFVLSLFGIVILHELGHALTARRYGIRTRDITLLPIGGVARLERIPDDPKQELLVALAGPAVNVLLAGLLFGVLALTATPGSGALTKPQLTGGHFLSQLLWVNVSLAVFNLLPAFPMDGGRVLRALLAMKMEYARATRVAASIGQSMALVFGLIGLFTNPILVVIALFVWIGAAQEARFAEMKSVLAGIPAGRVMITKFCALSPNDALSVAVEQILTGYQQDFPVVEGNRLVGVLRQVDLLNGLAKFGESALIGQVMQRKFETSEPTEPIEPVLDRLQEHDCRTVPVIRDGAVVGMLTLENIGEFLLIQAALHGDRPGRRPSIVPRARSATT